MAKTGGMVFILIAAAVIGLRPVAASNTPAVTIDLASGNAREQLTKQTLQQVLADYDLRKYTFTRRVVIDTVIRDEKRIASLVDQHHLRVR